MGFADRPRDGRRGLENLPCSRLGVQEPRRATIQYEEDPVSASGTSRIVEGASSGPGARGSWPSWCR